MKFQKKVAVILAIAMSLGCFTGCNNDGSTDSTLSEQTSTVAESALPEGKTSDDPEGEVIKIGVLLPFSGSASYFATSQLTGYQHALEDYMDKYADKLAGKKIELVMGDTTGKADTGVTEFERLVNEQKVAAVIGPYNSGVGSAIAPLAIKYKTPLMVTNAVADAIMSEPNDYVFRCNIGDRDTVDSWVEFLNYLNTLRDTPISKAAVVFENTDMGQGANDTFKEFVFPELGIESVVNEAFTNNSTDLSSVVNKVKSSGAEIVIPIMFINDALLFTRQMKEYECDVPMIAYGTGYQADEYLPQSGDAADYVICYASWLYDEQSQSDEANAWVARYIEDTGYAVPNDCYANGWMGMYVLLEAIAAADSSDSEAIAQAIAQTDISTDHRALLFHNAYKGIKFGETNGRYNQNLLCGTTFAQAQDGVYRVIYPKNSNAELIYPIPSWKERS